MEAFQRGDYVAALREFRPLAEQSSTEAQNRHGFMYVNGHGVLKDYAEAVKWHCKAANSKFFLDMGRYGTTT